MTINTLLDGRAKVDIKEKGRPRFRRTVDTYKEAQTLEREYLGGNDNPGSPVSRTAPQKVTLGDLFEHTVCEKWEDRDKKGPPKAAQWCLNNYWGWDRDARSITTKDISEFKQWLKGEGNTNATVNRKISALSLMFKLGVTDGLIESHPVIRQMSGGDKVRLRFLNKDEEEKLLMFVLKTRGKEWHDFLLWLVESGMRVSEACRMTWDDIDLEAKLPSLDIPKTKSKRPRAIPLTKRLRALLKTMEYGEEGDFVFPGVTPNRLNKVIWPTVRDYFNDYDKDFVPHILRHTRATRLVQAEVDIDTVREWMGHTTITTTMRYVKFSPDKYNRALEKLEDFDL